MLRRLFALGVLAAALLALPGCVAITSTGSSQPASMGNVQLTVSVCASGAPACPGQVNAPSAYAALLSLNDHNPRPAQLLFAVRLPDGAVPPDALTATGAAPAPVGLTRSPSYEAELQAFEPAPAGERWWGWLSNEFAYDIDTGQQATITLSVTLPRPPDGGPYPSPLRWRPVVGARLVDVPSGRTATRPVDCGSVPADLYTAVDSNSTACIANPDQAATRGYLDAAIIDFGVTGTSVTATAGGTATVPFLARRSGIVDPATTFALAVAGGPPGGSVTLDRATVGLGGDSTTPVLATVQVPPGTPPGSYPVTLTATAPGKPTRSGTATVVVPAAPAPPAADRTPPAITAALRPARVVTRRASAGTRLAVALSESAALTVRVERLVPGRRAGRTCRASTRTGRRCTATAAVGTVRRVLPAGATTVAVGPRLGRRVLVPGRYRLTLRAVDPAGNRSRERRLTLTIVRR